MLITSSAMKGKCPVCGAASAACGGPSNVIAVDESTSAAGSGPLKLYPLGPEAESGTRPRFRGRYVQLTDEAARARGLLPESKMKDSAPNKMRRPSQNKGR